MFLLGNTCFLKFSNSSNFFDSKSFKYSLNMKYPIWNSMLEKIIVNTAQLFLRGALIYFWGIFPRQAEILIWSFPGKVCSTICELIKNPKIHRFKKRIQKSSWIAVGFFRWWTKINLSVEENKNYKPNPTKYALSCKCNSSKIF